MGDLICFLAPNLFALLSAFGVMRGKGMQMIFAKSTRTSFCCAHPFCRRKRCWHRCRCKDSSAIRSSWMSSPSRSFPNSSFFRYRDHHKLGLGWVKYLNVRCIYACLFVCRCLQRPGLDTRNKESEKFRNIVMAPICAGFAARIRCAMHASHVRPQERQGNMGGPPIRVWQSAYRRWRSTRPV